MKKILIVSGHVDLNDSFANKIILEELSKMLPEAEFAYLDKLYPDFKIDVEAEQQKLLKANYIVFQFPFFWYSVPSLMKRWLELVFVHGFAYGSTGDKLKGKKLIASFTSGSPEGAYRSGGAQGYPVDDFLLPLKRFVNLCGMEWQPYVYSGGFSHANLHDEEMREEMKKKAIVHAARLTVQLKQI